MAQDKVFAREEIFPSWFANRIQDFLSASRTDLRLVRKSATEVEVAVDPDLGIAAISIEGRWRWVTGSISRVHPGGAKGTYSVWAVAADNNVDNTPKPFTDHTDYSFSLRITNGAEPAGEGIAIVQKIGEIDWSGAAIETVRQTHAAVTPPMLQDGVLSSGTGSDIAWTRDASGGYVAGLKENSVTALELADGSVDTAALIDLAVVTAKVAALAITEGKLAPNSVATEKIIALAVTSAKLAADAVIEEKIGNEAVSTAKIKLLAVTSAILAVESVTTEKVANLAITEAKIAAEAVGTGKIKNLAVTAAKIGEEAVSTIKLASLAVTTAKIAEAAVTTAKIADGAVTDVKLAKPIIAGAVSSTGGILDGTGFEAAHASTGRYTITLTTELAINGILVANAIGGFRLCYVEERGKKVFKITIVLSSTGALIDSDFSFMIKAS